jgi:hypothetical protein
LIQVIFERATVNRVVVEMHFKSGWQSYPNVEKRFDLNKINNF